MGPGGAGSSSPHNLAPPELSSPQTLGGSCSSPGIHTGLYHLFYCNVFLSLFFLKFSFFKFFSLHFFRLRLSFFFLSCSFYFVCNSGFYC